MTAQDQPQFPPPTGHVELMLGAYVLGALSAEEDRQVAAHLRGCVRCGAAYVEFAEAPWLLALLSEDDLRERPGEP
ncbi:zf-HC2 domain-containing protein [Streptomyces sp. GC420]|uniref:zf-HC2 domain-containing protein n=1 Tax=Streptomyces sp. GC420 TaxID=2697568 RepID=UPI0037DA5101